MRSDQTILGTKGAMLAVAVFLVGAASVPAQALSLRDAIATTIDSNPQIGAAIENREAIEFELRQARGLYMPRIDAEASAGRRNYDRFSIQDRTGFSPVEVGVVGTLKLFDGFGTQAEVERQASRVDGASIRIAERSEFLALEVARTYFDILLQDRLVGVANQNVSNLNMIVGRIRENVRNGSLTEADLRQAEERAVSSRARVIEARQALGEAKTAFVRLVGKHFSGGSMPPSMAGRLPKSIENAIGIAMQQNPRISMAKADIDAAHALVKKARSKMYPELFLEGRARAGRDIDGIHGRVNDVQGRVGMRMNLYNGGIDQANIQEQTRRVAEAQHFRDQIIREVREAVRLSFDRRARQAELSAAIGRQLQIGNRLVASYAEQFQVGRRSLLDLLDAQNTRYNANVLKETAEFATRYAEYRVLASMGRLLPTLGLRVPSQAEAYGRQEAGVPPTADAETLPRTSPNRGRITILPRSAL
jgi:adhesin transport system outer membrane protein